MNFLNRRSSWSNLELWIFKVVVFSCGLIAGVYLDQFLLVYMPVLIVFALCGCVLILFIWIRKLTRSTY
jgi:hypothetical protein